MFTKKILVVEDEAPLRKALGTSLTEAGHNVMLAPDGKQGLELALNEKPDLILLDINMPNMDGHQMLSKLRLDDWGKNVQVVFLTNYDDPKNISKGFELKGNDYIVKANMSLNDIATKVKQQLAGYHD
jgi:two-component system, OmpR family, alkaline phosphatase synthesis response regulator PhoP